MNILDAGHHNLFIAGLFVPFWIQQFAFNSDHMDYSGMSLVETGFWLLSESGVSVDSPCLDIDELPEHDGDGPTVYVDKREPDESQRRNLSVLSINKSPTARPAHAPMWTKMGREEG